MSEPSGVKRVVQKFPTTHVFWCNIGRVEPVCGEYSSLKRRLQVYNEVKINIDQGTKDVDALISRPLPPPSESSEKETQPASQRAAQLPQVVPASNEGTASATRTPPPSSQNSAAAGKNEKLNQTAANTLKVPSKPSSEKQLDASGKGEESSVVPQDTNSSEAKGEETVGTKPSPATPATDPSQRAQTTLKTSVKAACEVQEPIKPNPESTEQEPKTQTVTSQKELQTTGSSAIVETEGNPSSEADKVPAVTTEAASPAETESTKQSAGGQTKPDPTTGSAPRLVVIPTEKIEELQTAAENLCQHSLNPQVDHKSNEVCVETSEPSGEKQVVQKISSPSVDRLYGEHISLQRRLQDCSEFTNLDQGTKDDALTSQPPPSEISEKETQPASQGAAQLPQVVPASSATQRPPTSSQNLAPAGTNEKLNQTAAHTLKVPSKPSSEKLLDASAKGEESSVVPQDTNSSEAKGEETVGTKPSPATPATDPSQRAQTTLKTSVKAASKVQEPIKPNPESTEQEPKTQTVTSQKELQTTGSSDIVETERNASSKADKVPLPAVATAAASPAGTNSTKQSAAAGVHEKPDSTTGYPPVLFMTPREKIKELKAAATKLRQRSLKRHVILSEKLFSMLISLVITNLPELTSRCYKEADIIKLLRNYDIECEKDKLFIIPQAKMAFVFLPNVEKVQKFFRESKFKNVFLKGAKLFFNVISIPNSTALGFYTFLKRLIGFRQRITDPTKLVYIQNISQSEAADLWISVKTVGRVLNYLPLLGKVFIEFVEICGADHLGVLYSFLKQRFSYSIYRMGLPRGVEKSKALGKAPWSFLHRNIGMASWATNPTAPNGIPEGTVAPFWVTMTTSPYVFPTVSPWFNIPAFFTVVNMQHVRSKKRLPVIMLTGLPNENFTHEDVAMLVWKYFPEQNLHSLYYNVVVLPLQRRAFVHFHNWSACLSFLQDHLKNPVCLKNCALYIHIVCAKIFNEIQPMSCEEDLYKILMKWSNVHVPDLKSLEERLLCVEVSGIKGHLVSTVMKEVASIATFVSFLPLANRIYIEMAESSGVRKVVENLSVPVLSERRETWKQVGRIESLKSRKLRLEDCKRIAVNLEQGTIDVYSESTVKSSAASDKKTPETSTRDSPGSTVCEPARAGPSGTAINATSVEVCSDVDPKSDLKTEEKKKEESVPCCPLPSRSQVHPDLPSVDMDRFKALKEAINQYKLSKEAQENNEYVHSSKACVEPDLNYEDLVTVDEINEEVEEEDVDSSSSLKPTGTSLSSDSTSVSVKNQPHSPESNKSQTNLLSSACDSKTSLAASSSKSVESHVSPGQEAQPSTATPSRQPQSPSTGQSTISSSTPVKTSVETHTSHEKKDKSTESSVAEFDHKVSAESSTDPPTQGQKAEITLQTQKVETEFRDETLKEEKTSKEKLMNEEQKVSEEKGKVKEQTNEQIIQERSSETQIPEPEKDPVLHQEGLQASDGANEGETKTNTSVKEDKPNGTGEESPTAEEETLLVKDDGSTVKPDQTRVSEMKENQNSPLKQDKSLTDDRETLKDKERLPVVQDSSVSQRSVRRSTRGTKDQTPTRDKVTSDEPAIMTRSARSRRKETAENSANESKEKPTKPRRTPGRDLPKKEDSPKREDITRTKKPNPVRDSCEPKTSQEDFKKTEEKEQEAPTPRKRGRPRKETRLPTPGPVRKSARGIELESPGGQAIRGVETNKRRSMDDKNVPNKRRRMELVGPEAKRSRSQSPRVAADVKLPPFSPDKPLGKEFVSRKWGYFCHLCSVSYLDEGTTKDEHCRSQTHHENLQKYHQKLRQKPSRMSTQNSK